MSKTTEAVRDAAAFPNTANDTVHWRVSVDVVRMRDLRNTEVAVCSVVDEVEQELWISTELDMVVKDAVYYPVRGPLLTAVREAVTNREGQ